MDWRIKGRLLVVGCILIVLGLVLFVARGVAATLGLAGVGVVLHIVGIVYKPKQKKVEVEGNAEN